MDRGQTSRRSASNRLGLNGPARRTIPARTLRQRGPLGPGPLSSGGASFTSVGNGGTTSAATTS
eukprot:11180018-Lingulodinium_polyedra.AAC.1